jgi:hypothetical protein
MLPWNSASDVVNHAYRSALRGWRDDVGRAAARRLIAALLGRREGHTESRFDRLGSAARDPRRHLQLQAEEDPAQRRRRSARRGQDLLDGLDRLKAALLAGSLPAADLGRLARSLTDAGPSGDPQLDDLIGQIELRAKVELAKLGRIDLL